MRLRRSDRVDLFNRMAVEYDDRCGPGVAAMHDAVLRRADRAGIDPGVVLDVGCGTGTLLADVRRRWPAASLRGVDPAEGMLAVARGRLPDADLQVAGAEKLPYGSATVDLVLSTTSFGQWRDQVAGLREAARVLRPGGWCLVAEVLPVSLLRRMVYRVPELHDEQGMARLMTAAGLTVAGTERAAAGFVVTSATRNVTLAQ